MSEKAAVASGDLVEAANAAKRAENAIGKITEIDDIQRNILSILRRVAPNARIPASAVKIFVLQGLSIAAQQVIDDGDDGDQRERRRPDDGRFDHGQRGRQYPDGWFWQRHAGWRSGQRHAEGWSGQRHTRRRSWIGRNAL
jgi:hypothetical protein